jgi:hypothetical protein
MTAEYIPRVVKIIDALAVDDVGTDANPIFSQRLELWLQDIETSEVFKTSLDETDVRALVGSKEKLTTKQMIDLAIMLRLREEPVTLLVPSDREDLSFYDLQKTKAMDTPVRKKKRRRRYNKNNNTKRNYN